MTPVALKTVYFFLTLVAIPQAFAGPACAKRNYGKTDCVQMCKDRWGYGGYYMGQDKWGSVMSSPSGGDTDPDSVLSTACGSTATSDPAVTPTDPPPSSSSKPPSSEFPLTNPSTKTPPEPTSTSSGTSSIPTTSSSPSSTSTPHSPPPTSSPPTSSPPTSSPPTTSPLPTESNRPPPSSTRDDVSTPSPTPSAPRNDLGTSSDKAKFLDGHNNFRAEHGASPLTWSDKLADAAQQWGSGCVMQHSGGKVGQFGENLAAGTGPSYDITSAINSWTGEAPEYDPQNPTFSHFTQVVWKATTQLGCAAVTCDPGKIFDKQFGNSLLVVCEYDPPGNVIGQFKENVQP